MKTHLQYEPDLLNIRIIKSRSYYAYLLGVIESFIEKGKAVKPVLGRAKDSHKVVKPSPRAHCSTGGPTVEVKVWFIYQLFGLTEYPFKIFIGGPFVFIQKEFGRGTVFLCGVRQAVEKRPPIPDSASGVGGYDLDVPVADAIWSGHNGRIKDIVLCIRKG